MYNKSDVGVVTVWDTGSWEQLAQFDGLATYDLTFNPASSQLAAVVDRNRDEYVLLWDTASWQQVSEFALVEQISDRATGGVFFLDDSRLLTVGAGRTNLCQLP